MLHEYVQPHEAQRYGASHRGLYATAAIAAGTAVWWDDPLDPPLRTFTRQEILEHPERENLARYSYVLGHDYYGSASDPQEDVSYLFNHSCDGNCWYDGDSKLVTKRDIAAGEELTYDYGLTETEISMHAGMRCTCEAFSCRGILTMDQYRDPAFMVANAGHTSSHIARKAIELGWHHPGVYLAKKAPFQPGSAEESEDNGMFAMQPFSKGDVLLYFGGKVVGKEQFLKVQELQPTMLFVQVAPALWMVPTRDGSETPDHINHSCDPNCGMMDSVTVVAMRDIHAGEELSIDYATVMDETVEHTGLESFECKCGAIDCRGNITPRDYLIPTLQRRYKGYFPPFMQRKIDSLVPLKGFHNLDNPRSPVSSGKGTPVYYRGKVHVLDGY